MDRHAIRESSEHLLATVLRDAIGSLWVGHRVEPHRFIAGSVDRGAGEVDQLSGGSGADIFYLGDKLGAYYLDLESGIVGYAFISDFDLKDELAFHQTEGIRIVHQQSLDGIDGNGSAIYQDQDLLAFIQKTKIFTKYKMKIFHPNVIADVDEKP